MSKTASFRKKFPFLQKDLASWFPGHMASGMKNMQRQLCKTDLILEVHDARVPFSGRNRNFHKLLTAARPKILILNKEDLIDKKQQGQLIARLEQQEQCPVILTNCKDHRCKGLRKIIPTVLNVIKTRPRYTQNEADRNILMVIGIPNVGKSSLINQLRGLHIQKAKATQVGALPGITKHVLEQIKIYENPSVYLIDTPGILSPNISNIDVGMKLALCAILKDHLVGEITMADYLLYWLNKHENYSYVDFLGLKEPTDNIYEVLLHVAVSRDKKIKQKDPTGTMIIRPNLLAAANLMIRFFREGHFGKLNFDVNQLTEENKQETLREDSTQKNS